MSEPTIVPDSERRGLIASLPRALQPYASMMRLDRPIGVWLLFWPGAWAVALAGMGREEWTLILWLALGAWAMRSAGCVYNDIVDRDLDRRVERTRLRPLASGAASVRSAWVLLVLLCLIGLVVLLQLNPLAQLIALGSLAPVAAYPFMKRITWWPQAWLGLVFSWAALVGWPAVTGEIGWTALLLYAGSIAWVIGYDTIYALQDREDDALVGREILGAGAWRDMSGPASRSSMPRHCCSGARPIWRVRPDIARPRRTAADGAAPRLAGDRPESGGWCRCARQVPVEPLRRPADVSRLPGRGSRRLTSGPR